MVTRGRALDMVITIALGALITLLAPLWLLHQGANRVATARRRGRRVEIPRVGASSTPLRSVLDGRTPVIVEGLLDDLGLSDAATPEALCALAGGDDIGVEFHDASAPYFLYSGGYGAEVVERRTMRVADFVELMFERGVDPDVVVYRLFGQRAIGGKAGIVLDEFDRALTPVSGRRGEPRFSGVWVGSTGVVTPLHHDAWPGLLFQTYGSKRVAMYGPRDRTNLYFRSPLRGRGRWSDLPARSAEAGPAEYPRATRAIRWEGELRAGDGLYVPPFWAHEMEALEPNISVPFRFATAPRSYLDPGFLRPASEMLRARAGALAPPKPATTS